MEIKKIGTYLQLIDGLGMEFSLLKRADVRGSADIIYHMWPILLFCTSGIVIDVKK